MKMDLSSADFSYPRPSIFTYPFSPESYSLTDTVIFNDHVVSITEMICYRGIHFSEGRTAHRSLAKTKVKGIVLPSPNRSRSLLYQGQYNSCVRSTTKTAIRHLSRLFQTRRQSSTQGYWGSKVSDNFRRRLERETDC